MSGRDERPPQDVDREGSVVSGPARRQLTNVQKLGIASLLLVVFLAVIWIQQLTKVGRQAKQTELSLNNSPTNFRPAPIVLPPPPAPPLPMPAPRPQVIRPTLAPARREMTPAESPIFAFSGEVAAEAPQTALKAAATAPPASSSETQTSLTAKLRPTVLAGSKATMLPHPDFLVTKGTIIPCILQTTINTELPGYVKCVLPADVRGTTGNVVLLDRGTTIVGEIQSGLMQGQDRVFVLWDRAETPDHAIIELDSPGTDELGSAGVPGGVNNHLVERFGSAVLLTFLQGALQAGTALAGNSGTNSTAGFSFNNFQSNGQNIADTALQNSINIPPTLEVNQGVDVAIFVAKDLDFSDIYNLRVTSTSYAR